jgi:4'-phosphopantetheinyl transferase
VGAVAAGECDVWAFPVPATGGDVALLDPGERERLDRFQVDGARQAFVVSRTAQRIVLARYLGVAPADVRVVRTCQVCGDTAHGRPSLPGGPDYSVSHSGSWVLVAVAGAGRIGVDIEEVRPLADLQGLRRMVLSEAEDPAGPVEPGWFYRAWTRKEAVVKATGEGIMKLRAVVVSADAAASGGATWHLRDLPAPHGYAAALASGVPLHTVRVFAM